MPSRLLNLRYNVQWSDFQAPVPAGQSHHAHIDTKFDVQVSWSSGRSGTQLADSVVVTIELLRHKSWAKKTVINGWPKSRQDDLLQHEQGHYDITALMGRDFFIELMGLKGRTFKTPGELQREIRTLTATFDPQPIQRKYDSNAETDHGLNATGQQQWNGCIQKAFTQQRTPAVQAPDGTFYKVRLLEVLKAAGKR